MCVSDEVEKDGQCVLCASVSFCEAYVSHIGAYSLVNSVCVRRCGKRWEMCVVCFCTIL